VVVALVHLKCQEFFVTEPLGRTTLNIFTKAITILALLVSLPSNAAIIAYTDFSDFSSTTITSDTGAAIGTSPNFTVAGFSGSSGGETGWASSAPNPMLFTGLSAFEVGMIFGNDQASFDVTLSVFNGLNLLGSVVVATNGNDLNDQFIGLGSDVAFDSIELQYGAGSGNLARFITRIDLGYDSAAVPEPSIIALFAAGLFGLGFARRRKA